MLNTRPSVATPQPLLSRLKLPKSNPELPSPQLPHPFQGNKKYIALILLALFTAVIVKNAWVSDDAYITLRTVDNFINGYGLTWNIVERVQAYTHPLWMFLLSGAYFLLRNIYFSTLVLCLIVTLTTVALFTFRLARSPLIAATGLLILAASKTFVDYSTSGLENPLTHLLLVLFAIVFFGYQHHKRWLLWLSLLSCMMLLNRMDTILLTLPALLYAFLRTPQSKIKAIGTIVLTFLPFVAWELFSLFYYGFLFPNTAYAKLNTGIPSSLLFQHGIGYFISSVIFDPLLIIVLGGALILTFTMKDWKGLLLIAGMTLYTAYILKIGGDFMAARFLSPLFLMAVILVTRNIPTSRKTAWVPICAAMLLLGLLVPHSRWFDLYRTTEPIIDSRGVADEHWAYREMAGLRYYKPDELWPSGSFAEEGLAARQSHQKVVVHLNIGYFGYIAGRDVYIVDPVGLSEPLLARIPLSQLPDHWRTGHVKRQIPDGYLETLETGHNVIRDKNIALYYDKLRYVISGPLFDFNRLIEIWKFNTGAYNYLLRR